MAWSQTFATTERTTFIIHLGDPSRLHAHRRRGKPNHSVTFADRSEIDALHLIRREIRDASLSRAVTTVCLTGYYLLLHANR